MKSFTISENDRRHLNRRGLTLVELVLVLVILVALAGILIPMFGNITGMTHGSAGAAGIEETARSLQNHKVQFSAYPNQFDLLLTDHSDSTTLAPLGGTVAATELTTVDLTSFADADRIIDALLEAGVTELIENPDALQDEEDRTTFGTTETTANDRIITVTDTPTPANLVILGFNAIDRLGLEPTGGAEQPLAYVVLGVGNNNDGVGRSMLNAPVHFSSSGRSTEDTYSRFLAVFRIPAEEGAAILSSVVAVDVHDGDVEISGLGTHVREFHHAREQ